MTEVELIEEAYKAQKMSYAPYSAYHVGAALLCEDGNVIHGCNIENAAYTPSNCAERTAFFKAVSEGERSFQAIAIVGGKEGEPSKPGVLCTPCGVCRQVMAEFCDPKHFKIIVTDGTEIRRYTLEDLLPLSFGPENLTVEKGSL